MLPGNLRTKNIANLHFADHVLPPLMPVGPAQNFSRDERCRHVSRNRESE